MVAPRSDTPICRALLAAALLALLPGCELFEERGVPCGQATTVTEERGQMIYRAELERGETCSWPFIFSQAATAPGTVVEISLREGAATFTMDGIPEDEPSWIGPRVYKRGGHVLKVTATEDTYVSVLIHLQGAPLDAKVLGVAISNQAYTQQAFYSGMHGVLNALSDDGHGGRLLAHWLESFGQGDDPRTGPAGLLAKLKADFGDNPAQWQMAMLPFRGVTIDNRIDLMDGATHCGEVHYVLTSTAAGFEQLNFNFRFLQVPQHGDRAPTDAKTLHCMETARDWAKIGQPVTQDSGDPTDERLTEVLTRMNFKSVQTSEALGTSGDWQFREWVRQRNPDDATVAVLPSVFTPILLEHTVNVAAVNTAGATRDAFLAYVTQNAAALTARRASIPAEYLARSSRLQENAWTAHTNEKVDLTGVDAAILQANPTLRPSIEVVGCAGCHGASSTAVHARTTGLTTGLNESEFLRLEIAERLAFLKKLQVGPMPVQPFGPMQGSVLPPG